MTQPVPSPAGLAPVADALAIVGSRRGVRPINIPASTASILLFGPDADLYGWSFRETTGTATASFRLRSSGSNQGPIIASVSLNASESRLDGMFSRSLEAHGGCYLEILAGSIEGSLWVSECEHVY